MTHFEQLSVTLANAAVTVSVIGAWLFDRLPPLAALASILWMGYQWYHHPKMEERRKRRKAEKHSARAAAAARVAAAMRDAKKGPKP